ncbi:hypothetical protein OFY05_08530 [Pseudocitrobacter faecalis]|nr:hypothetical protein OFY05_08530 [Pseudocitrobacter faecalis]
MSRCRPGKRSAPGNGAELRLMRCAYQAYGTSSVVGRASEAPPATVPNCA